MHTVLINLFLCVLVFQIIQKDLMAQGDQISKMMQRTISKHNSMGLETRRGPLWMIYM